MAGYVLSDEPQSAQFHESIRYLVSSVFLIHLYARKALPVKNSGDRVAEYID